MNLRIAAIALSTIMVAACGQRSVSPAAQQYETATVEKRSLVLTVEAAGVIEPVRTVEIKSKASGEILELGADTGDTVKRGALLARIDPRTPRNRLDQAAAQFREPAERPRSAMKRWPLGLPTSQGLTCMPTWPRLPTSCCTASTRPPASSAKTRNRSV